MFKQGALTDEEMLELQGNGDNLASFQSYDDYLDSQITPEDLYYLEDEELARQLVELGLFFFVCFVLLFVCLLALLVSVSFLFYLSFSSIIAFQQTQTVVTNLLYKTYSRLR